MCAGASPARENPTRLSVLCTVQIPTHKCRGAHVSCSLPAPPPISDFTRHTNDRARSEHDGVPFLRVDIGVVIRMPFALHAGALVRVRRHWRSLESARFQNVWRRGGGERWKLLISNNRDLLEVTTISTKPSELCGTTFVCRRLAAVRRFLASDPTAGLLIGWVSWARRKRISVVAGALETCDADRGRGYMHAIQGLRRCDAVAFVMHLRFLPPAESGRRTCHTRGLFRRFRVSAPRKTCSNTFRKIAARSCGSGGACGGT